ncbi:MAG: DUF58 domain-containing protein [Gammaproteobacteria bacterium]|nr:DUF58 domain-containing protein [Gammaproteobacteria bacterium]
MSSIQWQYRSPFDFEPLRKSIARRTARWARKRQGPDSAVTRLASGRIYILPTGVGLVYALMTFAMLLGSMNYNNNLSFVLTFVLVALGLVSMHQCQRNLVNLEISFAGVEPVFAGQSADFRIAVTNRSRNYRHHIQIYNGDAKSQFDDIGPGESKIFELEVPTEQRGWVRLPRFGIRTLFPFELFRAWAWLHMDLQGLVYPKPVDMAPAPPASQVAQGSRKHDARGEEDFAGLRRFHDGDSPRLVAWKAYARSNELLSKQFSGTDISTLWIEFAAASADDLESRLSVLSRWVIDADAQFRSYGLRMPTAEYPPSHGAGHRHRCLEALALYKLPDEDNA